ncbi:MAG TPA: DUF2637 domain-containing protein [Pseudonocardiaceae bacterium]|nr:DUF2637 domain-containing protein [Pseudonocardiaceae bacterium]
MITPTSPAHTAVRVTTVTAVVVVAAVAAVVSYSHMTELAHRAGEQWRSWLIPISVDGLIVAASMVLLTRHRAGQPGGPLAWGSLGVGVIASLAANMADARPEVTSVLVAGWAPVAFAAAFHLLLQQRRAERATAPLGHSGNPAGRPDKVLPGTDGRSDSSSPSLPGPIDVEPVHPLSPGSGVDRRSADRVVVAGPLPVPVRPEVLVRPTGAAQTKPARKRPARTGSGSKRAGATGRSDEELVQAARELSAHTDGPLTQYAIRQAFGLGSTRAARVLDLLEQVPAGAPGSNGQARVRESN